MNEPKITLPARPVGKTKTRAEVYGQTVVNAVPPINTGKSEVNPHHELVAVTQEGTARVMDSVAGMIFRVNSVTQNGNRRIVHVIDDRYSPPAIWTLGPEDYTTKTNETISPDISVNVHSMPLSDRSRFYAVSVVDCNGARVIIDCKSERDAFVLSVLIRNGINEHTNNFAAGTK